MALSFPEAFTAWGKEVGGLQAGLGLRPGEKRAYNHGETVALFVRVRNVGKETVKFEYIRQFLDETPPTVTDADGKSVPQGGIDVLGVHPATEVSLEPGKEIELESRFAGGPNLAGAPDVWYARLPAVGTGKVSIQYERVFGNSSAGRIKLDPTLSKLATGKLELEIKSPENPRVSTDKKRATVEGQLDEARELVLRIGEEKDKLFWTPRQQGVPGTAMLRIGEEGLKRFWGDKAKDAGAFKAVVELSDIILLSDGTFASGFEFRAAFSEGAGTDLIGSTIPVVIPKTGPMPSGQLSLREDGKIVRKDGVITFGDIQKEDGKLVPVSFLIKKTSK